MTLSASRLHQVLSYNQDTGVFSWRISRGSCRIGSVAGTLKLNDYRYIAVDGKEYLAGRLAWYYVTGSWPINTIDHINRRRDDDRFENLREATSSQNNINKRQRLGVTGVRGVTKLKGKYVAQIMLHKHNYYLGAYTLLADATAARLKAEEQMFGEFSPKSWKGTN